MAQRSRPKSGQSPRKPSTSATPNPAQAVSARPHEPAPPGEAVARFDAAMQALQRHRYLQAAASFREILQAFPTERGLCDRSQVYLDLCERELGRSKSSPDAARSLSIEERLTAATAAVNDDDEDRAESLARQVLDEAPNQDLAMYLIAAIAARRGHHGTSLTWLARAVDANPEIRAQARHDDDFMVLREVEAFQRLMEMPAAPMRDPRKGRPER